METEVGAVVPGKRSVMRGVNMDGIRRETEDNLCVCACECVCLCLTVVACVYLHVHVPSDLSKGELCV